MNLDAIVAAYIRDHRDAARAEMRFFQIQRSLTAAIQLAALCRLPSGKRHPLYKRHPHQRRIPQTVLNEAECRLQRAAAILSEVPDFTALHHLVKSELRSIGGLGKLTIYDVAHRIGAFLGKAPTLVYLHAGTAMGARALGFHGDTIDPRTLPTAFAHLSAAEIEDCLCIYKDQLRDQRIRIGALQRPRRCRGLPREAEAAPRILRGRA